MKKTKKLSIKKKTGGIMNLKSFFKVNPIAAILAVVLVGFVVWNYFHILDVRCAVRDEINSLGEEFSTVSTENAKLKSINEGLLKDAMSRLNEINEMKSFLGDMSPEVSDLVVLSQCINCCNVGGQVVGMGPRLKYFKLMIDRFVIPGKN
jgi:hypothetical protein